MQAHPLIGFRETTSGREPYVIGSGLAVAEVVELVRALGSVRAAARTTGVSRALLTAGLAYDRDVGGAARPKADAPERTNLLQLATQIFGLFAGLATIVYVTGGIVLVLRLRFGLLAWEPVIGQLPRELLLSTGAGQVMIPALIVGVAYALFRLLHWELAEPPTLYRWRNGDRRGRVLASYALIAAILLVPAAFIIYRRGWPLALHDHKAEVIAAAYLLMLFPAAAIHEVRALEAESFKDQWRTPAICALMCGTYALASVPASIAAAAVLPLNDAKVCTTSDFEERGALVGQSGDRVYLGEPRARDRRLAVFPLAQVEELFIGSISATADCDYGSARLAIVADERAGAGQAAASDLHEIARRAPAARASDLAAMAREGRSDLSNAGLAALEAADAADKLEAKGRSRARAAGNAALAATERFDDALTRLQRGLADSRAEVLAQLQVAMQAADDAAAAAREAANGTRDEAIRRQPSPG